MITEIALKDINITGGTQNRPVDDDVVTRYQMLIAEGVELPPISIVADGHSNWLWDGFHRFHAYKKLGRLTMPAEVVEGTQRDALLMSFSANKAHGFARQKGTLKTMLFEKLFPDDEWGGWTDKAIAEWVGGCTASYVGKCRVLFEQAKNKPKTKTKTKATTKNTPPPKTATKPAESTPAMLDSVGADIPEHLKGIFLRREEIKEQVDLMTRMFKKIQAAVESKDPLYVNCKIDQLKAACSNVRSNLRFTVPYAVCSMCGGDVNNKECRTCNGYGWVNELAHNAIPEDMKNVK